MRLINVLIYSIIRLIQPFIKITPSKDGLRLVFFKLKHYLLEDVFRLKITSEKIHKYKISFFSYISFLHMFEAIFVNKEYYFKSKKENPLILDCGSNIGISILFFKCLYPKCRIISFEPDKNTFSLLKKNIQFNNLQDVVLHNNAISNTEGIVNLYYDPNNPGDENMSIIKDRLFDEVEEVQSVLLSNYINNQIDFMKMDIEGAETMVFEELSKKNKIKFIKTMVIEYHHHIKPLDDQLSKILRILEDNGFGYQLQSRFMVHLKKFGLFQNIILFVYNKKHLR